MKLIIVIGEISRVYGMASLDRYRIFLAVAETGSFTRAADRLFLSQPAVSQAIKKLETEMGVVLLARTARGIQLTPEGKVLFSHVQDALRLIAAGERNVAEMQQLNRGEIRIGASDTLCRHYLLPVLDRFHREYPQIRLHVTNRTSQETVALLRAGHIDFGVVNLPISDDRLVVYEGPMLQDCFVVGDRYRSLSEAAVPLSELAQHPLLLLETGSVTRSYMDAFFEAHGLRVTPEIELGSIDLLMEFARIGLGIAAVVRNFVRAELERSDLFEVATEPLIPPRSVGLIVPRDVPLPSAAEVLIAQLRQAQFPDS